RPLRQRQPVDPLAPRKLLHRQPARTIAGHQFRSPRCRRNPATAPVALRHLHLRRDHRPHDTLPHSTSAAYEVANRTLTLMSISAPVALHDDTIRANAFLFAGHSSNLWIDREQKEWRAERWLSHFPRQTCKKCLEKVVAGSSRRFG